jgi:phosphatidylglycerol:prolipoprotein diacylglycerol transferase
MHPVLFQIGSFTIGTYGLMIVIGLMSGLWLISRLARRRGLPVEFFQDLLFVALLSGFLGARLTYIGLNWGDFLKNPLAMILSRSGFVFLGGFIAAVGACLWFTKKRGLPAWEVADLTAPGVALGHAFGRIGCFLAGCCHGVVCTPENHPLLSSIAASFPVVRQPDGEINTMFNFAYGDQVSQGLLSPLADRTLPMLPVQLFESAGNFLICLTLVWLWRRRKFSGEVAGGYLALYSVLRFVLEFWRGDAERGVFFNGAISTSQIICLFTFAAGLGIMFWRRNRGIDPIPAAESDPAEAKPAKSASAKNRPESPRRKPSAQP